MNNSNIFKLENGTPYTGKIYVNGYHFAERLLEDVYFETDCIEGIINCNYLQVKENSKEYFENLNKDKWLTEAKNYFENEDEYVNIIDENGEWEDIYCDLQYE